MQLDLQREAACTTCGGTGSQPGTSPRTCPTCRGAGSITQGKGFLQWPSLVRHVTATGTINPNPCKICSGRGVIPRADRINVKIPPGVDNGSKVRVAGMGGPGEKGGPAGDIYIVTKVRPHCLFRTEGRQSLFGSKGNGQGSRSGRED